MYDRLVFYNHYGNGDIFESRKFVRALSGIIEAKEYCYAHGKPPYIIKDIEFITSIEVTDIMHPMSMFKIDNNILYINTWIGRDGKYVLPGIGVTVEKLYDMYNEILANLGYEPLKGHPFDYLPEINYFIYNIEQVNYFIVNTPSNRVLICNGPVHSMQAENFDMDTPVKMLSEKYPDKLFILTQKMSDLVADNIIYTSDIIHNTEGTDLNEISYLSLFCNPIIGRNSGPHIFAQNMNNWTNKFKKCLSFTYKQEASHFVLSDDLPMRKLWSPNTQAEHVFEVMSKAIEL